jgi:hypothetical protein
MKLVHRSLICVGREGTNAASCCFPALSRMSNGTYVATWRAGSRKDSSDGCLMLSRSNDDGRSWSTPTTLPLGPFAGLPGEPHYGPLSVLGPNHLLAAVMWVDRSDPKLPLFHPRTEGLLPVRTLFCESRDGGETWNDYREMDLAPYHSPMPITGPVLRLTDGRLACQFEVNKNYEDPRPWRHAAAWKISSDGGYTWPECVVIAHDPSSQLMYWDARYALGANGFCLAAFWTYDRRRQQDVNVHLSSSTDGGRTWSAPQDTGIRGQVCHPLLLDDGRLLLIYVDRYSTRSIRAVLSDDLGGTFHSDTVVYQHPILNGEHTRSANSADYLQEMDIWTFGRVDARAEPDGTVSIVFYAGDSKATNIHWTQLAVSPPHVQRRGDAVEAGRHLHAPNLQQVKPH